MKKIPLILGCLGIASIARADVLISHSFGGEPGAPLDGVHPDVNVVRPVAWNAGPIIQADGRVNDGTNTDQGLVFDLGLSWKFQPQSVYTATLSFTELTNGIVFIGFRDSNPSGNAQVQTQGDVFSLRVRQISGDENVGIFRWTGSPAFTNSDLSYAAGSEATFTLTIETNDLTDAEVKVGNASVQVDLSAQDHRYFFAGYEDPLAASPESDAKFSSIVLEGPGLTPLPQPRMVAYSQDPGEAELVWTAAPGESHTLQMSGDLVEWETVDGSDFFPYEGTGSESSVVVASEGPKAFFRLIRP